MVDRIEPDTVEVLNGKPDDREQYIESDFRRRSGLCPNGCGLMFSDKYGQSCPVCNFSCNTLPELTQQ